jgi:hypothetical protein
MLNFIFHTGSSFSGFAERGDRAITSALAKNMNMRAWAMISVLLAGCEADDAPKGEGSYRAAERIAIELAKIKAMGGDAELPDGYYRFDYDDGSWYVATGTDSHAGPDGGTIGVLTSDGETGIFFTHVCGPGQMPVTFFNESPEEAIAALRSSGTEYKRQQGVR